MNIKIINSYKQKLINKGYSDRTINIYTLWVVRFCDHIGDKQIVHANSSDFNSFILNTKYSSPSAQNACISAIKILYRRVLSRKFDLVDFERPRKTKKLPYIIEQSVVINTLNSIKNKKHKAILYLAYSCGLRRGEIINLKLSDFNKESHTIYIRNAKGQKDRVVALSNKTRDVLVEYYRGFNPSVFLFNGQNSLRYSASSCANIMKRYFGRERHIHELRHCYASHCLDSGIDTRTLQATLGHNSPKTVAIYTHVSPKLIREAVAV